MQQNNIQLSILIPSIPSRFEMAQKLYTKLVVMGEGMQVEIIMLTDNKIMSIGEKCNRLMRSAHGKYFCFIHDDDELLSLNEIYKATAEDVDVITFNAKCKNSDGSTFIVNQKLGNRIEHNTNGENYINCNRPPFPNCAWRLKFRRYDFPDISYGEDWGWIKQCLKTAVSGHHIDKILFSYNFSPTITEAPTESNTHWVNPNTKEIKRAIVNVSTKKYWNGQMRLIASLKDKTDATILSWQSEDEVGAEPHEVNNYAFKPMAIVKAYEMGYRQILWLDASMDAIKDLSPLFEVIERDGYFFQWSGWFNNQWTNGHAKDYFGTDEGIMISSGVLGLDLTNPIAYQFMDKWTQAMRDGIFNGSWDNHRHDQTAASLIAYKMGLKIHDEKEYFAYGKQTDNENVLILADGIS